MHKGGCRLVVEYSFDGDNQTVQGSDEPVAIIARRTRPAPQLYAITASGEAAKRNPW